MGYQELYIAIWENAINQDMVEVKRSITEKAFAAAFRLYQIKVEEPLKRSDKRFVRFKKDIKDYINLKIEPVEQRVRELIYQEMLQWPDNRCLKLKDEKYKKAVKELEENTKEFALERMSKRWHKL